MMIGRRLKFSLIEIPIFSENVYKLFIFKKKVLQLYH